MTAKYSFLESLFSDRWQWVRKRSRCLWVKDGRQGYMWVKFTDEELQNIGEKIGITDWKPTFEGAIYEDWRIK